MHMEHVPSPTNDQWNVNIEKILQQQMELMQQIQQTLLTVLKMVNISPSNISTASIPEISTA